MASNGDLNPPAAKKAAVEKHPKVVLEEHADEAGVDIIGEDFAKYMDGKDELAGMRNKFHVPKMKTLPHVDMSLVNPEDDCVYMCGNSLGLVPKSTEELVKVELDKWADIAVFGHFEGDLPWALCDTRIEDDAAKLVGGRPGEVAIMNGLTVNIHLLMISFYQPTADRHKILIESKAFPSDHYVVESQIRLHGREPRDSMVSMTPREGEETLRIEDIEALLERDGKEIALVLFPGVQYYTGQVFDMARITAAAHKQGCIVGWDLAHAVGNVEIHLHDWDVDFAAWCTYKYMNSGAGCLAGAFLHEKHKNNTRPKLLGWWGHKDETRFRMDNEMDLEPGIHGYRISNPAGLLAPCVKASLKIFNEAPVPRLRRKSVLLTGYLELLLWKHFPDSATESSRPHIRLLTPSDPNERGCQLSIAFSVDLNTVYQEVVKRGAACDKRLPHVLRVAPCPLYNSFHDVWRFIRILEEALVAA